MNDKELEQQSNEPKIQYFERLIISGISSVDVCKVMLKDVYANLRYHQHEVEQLEKQVELYEGILRKEGYPPRKKKDEKR